jgi:hypothetical protein
MRRFLPPVLCLALGGCAAFWAIATPVIQCLGALAEAAKPLIPRAAKDLATPDYLARLDALRERYGDAAVCAVDAASKPVPQAAAMAPTPDVKLLRKNAASWFRRINREVK